jgi:hypothetical protein
VPDSGGQYRLKFVLMQTGRPEKIVAGTAALAFDGLLRGKPVTLSFAQVSSNHRSGLSYSFRYFQDYDESVQLPSGFDPTRIGIEIRAGKDAAHGFRQAFVWKAQGMSVETDAPGVRVPGSSVSGSGSVNVGAQSRGNRVIPAETD